MICGISCRPKVIAGKINENLSRVSVIHEIPPLKGLEVPSASS